MSRTALTRLALIVALALLFPTAAFAKGKAKGKGRKIKQVDTLLLPVKVKGLEVELARRLGRVMAKTVVDEMGDLRILNLLKGKNVKAKVKQLKKKKVLVSNCHEDKKCIKAVGKHTRTRALYYAELSNAPKGVTVTIIALDVRSGKAVRTAAEAAKADEADVARATRWATRKASSPLVTTMLKGKGRLLVACEQPDAVLFINGKSFGKRTNKGFKVGAGVFDLQVKKDGFSPYHDVVVVKPDEELKVAAALVALSRPVDAVVAAVTKPADKTEKKPNAELPAWAVFDKKPKPEKVDPGAKTGKPKLAIGPTRTTSPKPFLPVDEKPQPKPDPRPDKVDDGDRWYQTWWFWTVVGVVAVGGIGGGLYAGGVFEGGGGSPSTGAALVTWQ